MSKKFSIVAILAFILIFVISCSEEEKVTSSSEEEKVTSSEKETYTDEYKSYLEAKDYRCQYYQKYIWKTSEREFGKKQHRYTVESLQKIESLKEEGKALCDAGKLKKGEAKLIEAVTIINFTMMK